MVHTVVCSQRLTSDGCSKRSNVALVCNWVMWIGVFLALPPCIELFFRVTYFLGEPNKAAVFLHSTLNFADSKGSVILQSFEPVFEITGPLVESQHQRGSYELVVNRLSTRSLLSRYHSVIHSTSLS